MSHDMFVNDLVDGIALRQEFFVNNSMKIKENDQYYLDLRLKQPRFLEL